MRSNDGLNSFNRSRQQYSEALYLSNLSPEFIELAQLARLESRKLNKEGISVSLSEAYLISELVQQSSSQKFIELGSLTGYSALFILRGLKSGGEIFCFEKDDYCADFLESLFSKISNVTEFESKKATVIRGDARERLVHWTPPVGIDGIFIDANKGAYIDYLNWVEANLSGEYLILADNVFLNGAVWGNEQLVFSKKQIQVMDEFNRKIITNSNYHSFLVGTEEGLLVARRRSNVIQK